MFKPKKSLYERPTLAKYDKYTLKPASRQLAQTERDVSVFAEDRKILTKLKQVFNMLGAVLVTSEGRVQFMTQRGEQLLHQYFASHAPNSLPKLLQHWFKHQVLSRKSEDKILLSCFLLQVEQAEKQLLVRFVGDPIEDRHLLLLEEQELQIFSISSLELLGLTRREAEILFWVAKDKSNAAIANILGCCKGTVRKHLEHIHQKLGVQTRTAAVMVALEKLGILRSSFVAISP